MTAEDLEILVDSVGVRGVLEMLAQVCHEKADHIRTNWQDTVTAHRWARMGRVCAKAEVTARRERI